MRDHEIYQRVMELLEKAVIRAGTKIKKGAFVDATLVNGATLPNSYVKEDGQVAPDVHATVLIGKAKAKLKPAAVCTLPAHRNR
jgi:hypothetical protein